MFIPFEKRQQIARNVIGRLGTRRAKDGTHPVTGGHPNKTGHIGVDFTQGRYRARIRFMDSLNGKDTRITLGYFDNAMEAGFAYAVSHVKLWGSLSYFVGEITAEDLRAIADAAAADILHPENLLCIA